MMPLSLAEVKNLVDKEEQEKETDKKEIKGYLKKFLKLKAEEAKKLRQELEKSEIMKIKPEHIVKIIDILPEDASDVNKIFIDASLDENEINKILETVKKYR